MCFALPKRIKQIAGLQAILEDDSKANLGKLQAHVGDYILVAGPIALEIISPVKARSMRSLVSSSVS